MGDKISVVVPVYNVEKYLEKCVESITNQTYKNLEIILVNDGSTDNSGKLCDELVKKDSRIRVIHKENGGVSEARNIGIEESTSDIITFVDSDDIIASYMIDVLYKNLVTNNVDISIGNVVHSYNFKYKFKFLNKNKEVWNTEETLKQFLIAKKTSFYPVAKLYKKKLFNETGFNTQFYLAEDALFLSEILLKNNCKVCYCYDDVYAYCHRNESATTSTNYGNVFDTIKVYDIIISKISNTFPNLNRYLILRKNWALLTVYDKLLFSDNFKKDRKLLREKIRNSSLEIIREDLFNTKRKIAILGLLISEKLYKKFVEISRRN